MSVCLFSWYTLITVFSLSQLLVCLVSIFFICLFLFCLLLTNVLSSSSGKKISLWKLKTTTERARDYSTWHLPPCRAQGEKTPWGIQGKPWMWSRCQCAVLTKICGYYHGSWLFPSSCLSFLKEHHFISTSRSKNMNSEFCKWAMIVLHPAEIIKPPQYIIKPFSEVKGEAKGQSGVTALWESDRVHL